MKKFKKKLADGLVTALAWCLGISWVGASIAIPVLLVVALWKWVM